tara:strand:+ start:86 stop:280 length:195 start_codon:yes stop_codon:yes gene_type:complete
MSYADSLTYEEGRLQGMQDLKKMITSLTREAKTCLHKLQGSQDWVLVAVEEQQRLVDEMRGEEE